MKRPQSALLLLASCLITLSLSTGWSGPAGAVTWPKVLKSHLLVRTYNSMSFGSLVTRSSLKEGPLKSKVLLGRYGYALETVGIYQYPVSTVDHGQLWRIAGNYFNMVTTSVMGAGGTASNIVELTRSVAVAFDRFVFPGLFTSLYVTVDSGRQWYVTYIPGTIQGVGSVLGGPNRANSVVTYLSIDVISSTKAGVKHPYHSINGGRTWTHS
jgi:hypothetical protein